MVNEELAVRTYEQIMQCTEQHARCVFMYTCALEDGTGMVPERKDSGSRELQSNLAGESGTGSHGRVRPAGVPPRRIR